MDAYRFHKGVTAIITLTRLAASWYIRSSLDLSLVSTDKNIPGSRIYERVECPVRIAELVKDYSDV